MDTPLSGACAVLREDSTAYDIQRAAAAMAQVLGGVAPDWSRELRDRPGVLADNLPADMAQALASALTSQRIPAFAMPQDDMAIPPPPLMATEAVPSDEGLLCRSGQQAELVPWEEVVLFDCARVRAASLSPLDLLRGRGRAAPAGQPAEEPESSSRDLLDIICYEPWLHVRIDAETFQFASLGAQPQSARRLGFASLVRLVRGHCQDATAGPGALLILGRRAGGALSLPSLAACDNHLLWRLQLLWREEA